MARGFGICSTVWNTEIAAISWRCNKPWGSPITPWFNNWAFNRERGADIKPHWDLIPNDIDILITHGPLFGILDETVYSKRTGCEELLLKVYQVKPKLHVFGHIYEDYGQYTKGNTTFVNASVLDDHYQLVNQPVVINLDENRRSRHQISTKEESPLS